MAMTGFQKPPSSGYIGIAAINTAHSVVEPHDAIAQAHDVKEKTKTRPNKKHKPKTCTEMNVIERIKDVPHEQCPIENRLQYSSEGARIAASPDTLYARGEFVPCRLKECSRDARTEKKKQMEDTRLFQKGKLVSCVVGHKKLMSGQFVSVREMTKTSECPKVNRRNTRFNGALGPDVSTLP